MWCARSSRPDRERRPVRYDTGLTRYGAVLRRAWAVQPRDRVLDVGCGAGQTTREAARMARAGSALGVDQSGGRASSNASSSPPPGGGAATLTAWVSAR
jgi:SAM-dependent methyltransferase